MSPPDADALDAIAALQRVSELFAERRQQLARDAGITETQWQVLEEVDGEDFMPSMFAQRRSCTKAAVSRTLRQLLEADLVRAAIGTRDGRQRVYRLTPKGRRTLERLKARRQDAILAIWKPIPSRELRSFTRFANDLGDRLQRYAEDR